MATHAEQVATLSRIGRVVQADRDCPVHSVVCDDWVLIVGYEEKNSYGWWTLELYAERSDAMAVASMMRAGPAATEAVVDAGAASRLRKKGTTPPLPTSALGFICTGWRALLNGDPDAEEALSQGASHETSKGSAADVRQRTMAALAVARERVATTPKLEVDTAAMRERAAAQGAALKERLAETSAKLAEKSEKTAAALKEKMSVARKNARPTIDALKERAASARLSANEKLESLKLSEKSEKTAAALKERLGQASGTFKAWGASAMSKLSQRPSLDDTPADGTPTDGTQRTETAGGSVESAEEWMEAQDPSSGKTYYYNTLTRETSWVPPSAAASAPVEVPTADLLGDLASPSASSAPMAQSTAAVDLLGDLLGGDSTSAPTPTNGADLFGILRRALGRPRCVLWRRIDGRLVGRWRGLD